MSNTVKSHIVEEGEAVDEVVHGGLGVHAANQLLGVVAEQLERSREANIFSSVGSHSA